MDHLLGRAFSGEVMRREIDRADHQQAREIARRLLALVELQRQTAEILARWEAPTWR
jgi:hypothetical protein